MRLKTYVSQPVVTLPEEEYYWCVASERKKWGQDLKHLNTTSGKTNDEGKRGKVAQSGDFCLEKKMQGNVLLQQPELVTHNPKARITIHSYPRAIMSVCSVCMHACSHTLMCHYLYPESVKCTLVWDNEISTNPTCWFRGPNTVVWKKTMKLQLAAFVFAETKSFKTLLSFIYDLQSHPPTSTGMKLANQEHRSRHCLSSLLNKCSCHMPFSVLRNKGAW